MTKTLLLSTLLVLTGCGNMPPMSPQDRAFMMQQIQMQQANTSRIIDAMAPQPYQIIQPQQYQPMQFQPSNLQRFAPVQTDCVRSANRVSCTSYP